MDETLARKSKDAWTHAAGDPQALFFVGICLLGAAVFVTVLAALVAWRTYRWE